VENDIVKWRKERKVRAEEGERVCDGMRESKGRGKERKRVRWGGRGSGGGSGGGQGE